MCSMPFDISKFAKGFDVSESDTELREIPLDKIRENPENFYPPLPEDEAEALGADAVVGLRYGSASVMQGAAEVIAYGTAVRFLG